MKSNIDNIREEILFLKKIFDCLITDEYFSEDKLCKFFIIHFLNYMIVFKITFNDSVLI